MKKRPKGVRKQPAGLLEARALVESSYGKAGLAAESARHSAGQKLKEHLMQKGLDEHTAGLIANRTVVSAALTRKFDEALRAQMRQWGKRVK